MSPQVEKSVPEPKVGSATKVGQAIIREVVEQEKPNEEKDEEVTSAIR